MLLIRKSTEQTQGESNSMCQSENEGVGMCVHVTKTELNDNKNSSRVTKMENSVELKC